MKLLYVEDTYAEEALKMLVEKLKEMNIIERGMKVVVKFIPGLCSTKFERVLKAASEEYEKVIILIDGHGDPDGAKKREEEHLPREEKLREKIVIVVNRYEIEEWILYAKGIPQDPAPSKKLWEITRGNYTKRNLPREIEKILRNEDELKKLLSYSVLQILLRALTS